MCTRPARYRPEIDGLRAISVVFVILFHGFPSCFVGGFVGVDVFFVISGYLIASLICQQLTHKKFEFRYFYIGRFLRLIPTLLVTLILVMAAGHITFLSTDYFVLARNTIASLFFYQNFNLIKSTGYFSSDAENFPLLHLWSLSIEGQFYLFFPFVSYLVAKGRIHWTIIVIVLTLISLFCSISANYMESKIAYLSSINRFWEILIGSQIAFIEYTPNKFYSYLKEFLNEIAFRLQGKLIFVLFNVGLISGLLACIFLLDGKDGYPGLLALFPVSLVCLLLASLKRQSFLKKLLSTKFLVLVGIISYPLYMFHWPVFFFFKKFYASTLDLYTFLLALVVTLLLSMVSYNWIEKPLRFSGRLNSVLLVGSAFILVALFSAYVMMQNGLPMRFANRINQQVDEALKFNPDSAFRHNLCFLDANSESTSIFSDDCTHYKFSKNRPTVVLWGDSHAASIYRGLEKRSLDDMFNLFQYTASGCPPVLGFNIANRPLCKKINESTLKKIKEIKPEYVILSAYWAGYNGKTNNDPNGIWEYLDTDKLRNTIIQLKSIGIDNIVVIGSLPAYRVRQPDLLVRHTPWSNRNIRSYEEFNTSVIEFSNKVKNSVEGLAIFIDPLSELCNDEGCLLSSTSDIYTPIAFDYGHLTDTGSVFVVDKIFKEGFFK